MSSPAVLAGVWGTAAVLLLAVSVTASLTAAVAGAVALGTEGASSSKESSTTSDSCSRPVTTVCPVFVPTAPAPVSNVRVFLNPFKDGRTVGTSPCSVHFSAFSSAASALEKVSGFGYTNSSWVVSTPSLPFSQSWAECLLNGRGLAQPLIFAAMVFMRIVSLAPLPPQSFQAFLYPLVSSATWAAATAKRTADTRMVLSAEEKKSAYFEGIFKTLGLASREALSEA
mmetsp:Transcript_44605/g.95157  ORF Transcript_44605/g.95157 Transcript_44605/m.95157 type:complete len:227 (+) Transcript_44605:573-1253(+)